MPNWEALGDASKHEAGFVPWQMSLQADACFPPFLPPSGTNQSGAALAEEDGRWWNLTAVAPRPGQDTLGLVTGACSWLCTEDHREPRPSSGRCPAWKCLSKAKSLGKGTAVDRKAICKVIILPGKSQTVGNGKKGRVSRRTREKLGLRRS